MANGHRLIIERNRLIYLASNIIGHLYVLITIPLLTRNLTSDEFGLYTILFQIIMILQAVGLIFFTSALQRFYIEHDGLEKKAFIGTIISTFTIAQIVILLTLYLGGDRFFLTLFPNITLNVDYYITHFLIWIFLTSLRGLLLTFTKVIERPWISLTQSIMYGFSLVAFLYWNIVLEKNGLLGVLNAFISAELIPLMILSFTLKSYLSLACRYEYAKNILSFSAPLALSSILLIIFINIDRITLSRFISISDMGIYGIGYMVGNIMALIVTSNASSYSPRMMNILKHEGDEAAKKVASYFLSESIMLMGSGVAILTIFNDLILLWLGKDQSALSASMVALGIAVGNVARSQFIFFQQNLFFKNKPWIILSLHLALIAMGFFSAYELALHLGMRGASFMQAATYFILIPIAYALSQRYFRLVINIRSVLLCFLVIFSLIVIENYLDHIGRPIHSLQYLSAKFLEIVIMIAAYGRYFIKVILKYARDK